MTGVPRADRDEEPLVEDAAPLRSVAFEPRRVGRSGARAWTTLAVWAAVLVAVVGVGLLGGRLDGEDDRTVRQVVERSPSAPTPTPAPTVRPVSLADGIDPIVLLSPAPGPIVVTTRHIGIDGRVAIRADSIEVTLEARNNRVLETSRIDVSAAYGDIRPGRSPTFHSSFELPFPRPNGTMWVVVTAYDATGLPLGGIRRPFQVGQLLEPRTGMRPRIDATPVNPPQYR